MSDRIDNEMRLVADVVHNEAYTALRSTVQARCVREMRERQNREADLVKDLVGQGAAAEARRPPASLRQDQPGGRMASTVAQTDESYPAFLESVRAQSLSAMRSRRVLPVWFRMVAAAAAVVVVLLGTWVLLRPSTDSAPVVAQVEQEDLSVQGETPNVPLRPAYLVRSRPAPAGVVVRTADRVPTVEIISDDELLEAVPGIAIARVEDPRGGRKIFVNSPQLGWVVHAN